MLTRKLGNIESGWNKADSRFKTWTYTLIHELLQVQIRSTILYKLLLFIEMVQFFWFSIHSNFAFLWPNSKAGWLRAAVEYLQLDHALNLDNSNIFLIALYIVFGVQVIMLLLGIATTIHLVNAKKKSSTIVTYSLKILSGYYLLLTTVLALPFYNVYLASLICYDGDNIHTGMTCYQGTYIVHVILGAIGLIINLITTLGATALYIDLNPWSTVPFASPQSKMTLLKLIMKIAVCLYIVIDYKANGTKEFIAIYGVAWILILALRFRQTPHYNRSIFRFTIGFESINLWACIVANVHAFIDSPPADSIGLFYLFFGIPFFAYFVVTIIEYRTTTYRKRLLKNFKKDTDVEMYINVIFNLIEHRDKSRPRMALEGLLKHHVKHCNKKEGECCCSTLQKDFIKDQEPDEKLWYTWIKFILMDVLEKFPKSTRLHMLYAYIQREKLHNKFKALYEMMITEDNKPSIEEEFSIFSYKNVIEEELEENDARNVESKGVDVNIIVDFQNKFVDFQYAVETAVDLHLEFWRELLENQPDIQKLQMLGSKINNSIEVTQKEFKRLNDINPNHIKMLQIYGNYLKDIVNDEVEGQRTLEKAEYVDKSSAVNKQFIDNDHLKYGENSNTCIVTVSGNIGSLGTIKNVNNEITRILGFAKTDLIGQNISRIMPKIVGDLHDGFMKRYFETSEARVMGQERVVFPINKDGYIIPSSLMIKVLPNLDEGIRLVGFLKDIDKGGNFGKGTEFETEEEVHHIVYSGDTGVIHGITHSVKKDYGIPASLMAGANANNDFTMDIVFPDLISHTVEELKNPAGVVLSIDTSSLQQNYLLGDNESEESEYQEEEEEREKRYRKATVRAVLVEDSDYHDTNMKVLKFVEVQEDGEYKIGQVTKAENVEQTQQEASKMEDESKQHEIDPNRSAEYNASDRESSISGAETANDDIKQLKDFKALISEKTVPKSIRLLSRAVGFILVSLIVLAILILVFRLKEVSEFNDGITSIQQTYSRTDLLANINYLSRDLWLIGNNVVTDPTGSIASTTKNTLITLIDNLSNVQFNVMRYAETLTSANVNTIDSQYFTIEHQVSSSVTTESRIFTDSVFQYITSASAVRNATMNNLNPATAGDSTPNDFFFVRRNGLGPLRNGSELEAQTFYNYYINQTTHYNTIFIIILVVALVKLAIADAILIPIVFSVHRTNDRVLAFFGYIPLAEITELAAKCERFMEKYIEDHKTLRDFSYEGSEGEEEIENTNRTQNIDNSYLDQSQNQENTENESVSQQLDVSERIEAANVNQFTNNNLQKQQTLGVPTMGDRRGTNTAGMDPRSPTETSNILTKSEMLKSQDNSRMPISANPEKRMDSKKGTMKDDDKRREEEAELEAANDRSQKLLNSRNNRRTNVVLQFVILAMIFAVYYIVDYAVVAVNLKQNVQDSLTHFSYIAERKPIIRYLQAFTLEEIAQMSNLNDIYAYPALPWIELRQYYQAQAQLYNQYLSSPVTLGSSSFDTYSSAFLSYSNGDICASYYAPLGTQATCNSVANGLLTKGLIQAITTLIQKSDDIMKAYNATNVALLASQQAAISSTNYVQADAIMNTIMPPLDDLITKYQAGFQDFLSKAKVIEIIKFIIFLLFCIFVFVFIWRPYLGGLKDKIFRTKGMLNMIPMDIISKNESLRGLFLSGNILQAVK